jgi:hypothetical protein
MYIVIVTDTLGHARATSKDVMEFKTEADLKNWASNRASLDNVRVFKGEELNLERNITLKPKNSERIGGYFDR